MMSFMNPVLEEENIRAYLPPLSYTFFDDHTIPLWSQAALAKKCFPSPLTPPMGKGRNLALRVLGSIVAQYPLLDFLRGSH